MVGNKYMCILHLGVVLQMVSYNVIMFCLEVYKSYGITFLFSITHKEYFVFHIGIMISIFSILLRINRFLVILSWYALLNIGTASSLLPSATDKKWSLISRHLLCPGWLEWGFTRDPKFVQSFIGSLTNACSELLNNTQLQNTRFSDWISHPLIFI